MPNIRIKDLENSSLGSQIIKTDIGGVPEYVTLTTLDVIEDTNLYFTNARARNSLSGVNGINYNPSTGIISLQSIGIESDPVFVASPAYTITTLEKTHWNSAYNWGNHSIIGYTIDSNLTTSVDYINFILKDFSNQNSINWNSRLLLNSSGIQVFDWGNQIIYDGSNNIDINLNLRTLHDLSNNISLNWQNRKLLTSSSSSSVEWETFKLNDYSNLSLNWLLRTLYYTNGTTISIDWKNAIINDKLSNISVDYDARKLYNASGAVTFDWNTIGSTTVSTFNDSFSNLSIDVENRNLYYTNGTVKILEWGHGKLNDYLGNLTVNFFGKSLYDSTGNVAIDWELKYLNDSTGTLSLDYNNRTLLYQDGTTICLNYETSILNDNTGVAAIEFTTRKLKDNTGLVSIDWGSKELSDLSGYPSITWHNRMLKSESGAAVVHWGIVNTFSVLQIKSASFLQIDDNYNGTYLAATVQAPSITHGYGDTTVAVLGQPLKWIIIKDALGLSYNVPCY